MFLKPANFQTENGIKTKSKMSPEKIHVQWKLENWKRDNFEIYQNNTSSYLFMKKNYTVFHFKRPVF